VTGRIGLRKQKVKKILPNFRLKIKVVGGREQVYCRSRPEGEWDGAPGLERTRIWGRRLSEAQHAEGVLEKPVMVGPGRRE